MVVKEIDNIIQWYKVNFAKAHLHQVMDAKSRLLTLCYTFSDETATSKRNSVIATAFRKAEHHKIKSQLIDEGMAQGTAESKSIEQTKDIIEQEAEHEALAYKHRLVLDIALKIAEDMTQRISILKKEMESSRGQT